MKQGDGENLYSGKYLFHKNHVFNSKKGLTT